MPHGSAADESLVVDDTAVVELKITLYLSVSSLRERGPGLDRDLSYGEMKEIAHADRPTSWQDIEV